MLPLRPALRLSLLATALVAANLAHADVPASAPFTTEQQLALEKYQSGLADKAEDVASKLDKLEARLQSKQEYDKDVLALGQKNIDWMLGFLGLTLAAAAFLGWRTKARIESEWVEQKQQMDKAHQQAVTDTDKAREALTQEVGRSLEEARERLRELREELKHARNMNTEIRQIRDSANTPTADAPPEVIDAAQRENEAKAEHSPQSKLAALAQKFGKEENWEEAASRWLALTDLEPTNDSYWFNYGYVLSRWLEQCKEPEQVFLRAEKVQAALRKAIELRPMDVASYFNWGNVLTYLAKFEMDEAKKRTLNDACGKYSMATRFMPSFAKAFYNWGNALSELASVETNAIREKYLIEACSKYSNAIRIKPDLADAYYNWGNVLFELGKAEASLEQQYLADACVKYCKAAELQPEDASVYGNWGIALVYWGYLLGGAESVAKFQEAEPILLKATKLGHLRHLYDLACLQSLQNRPDEARELLQKVKVAGFLPSYSHLSADLALDNLRSLHWFKKLLEDVKEQESISV